MVSIIVPVYNERETVKPVVERLAALSLDKEIVIIDDGSDDGTRRVLEELDGGAGVRVIRTEHRGKGAAVRRGFSEARGGVVIVHDADFELEPEDILRVSTPVLERRAEIVFGSRFLSAPPRSSSPHYWANRALTALFNALYGTRLTDVAGCYKCCSRELVMSLGLESAAFEIECEIAAKVVRRGLSPVEVPVSYKPRTRAQGKKIGWLDGLAAAGALLKYRA